MVLPIDNYSFIEGFRRETILHPSNNLEFVVVESAYVSNRSICDLGIFILIFFNEGTSYMRKLVFV